jgi:hypothetical protein
LSGDTVVGKNLKADFVLISTIVLPSVLI